MNGRPRTCARRRLQEKHRRPAESPSLTIIELLQHTRARVSYHDPTSRSWYWTKVRLQMECVELNNLGQYDCVVIVIDRCDYDCRRVVEESPLVVDMRNAMRGISELENLSTAKYFSSAPTA